MANITVDIQAKVVGYEQSIKALQAALAKVDPGSDIGKSITKAMEQAQSQVKALSKNMFPKASSDSQIDSIIEKTNRAGEAIQNVAALLQGVQVGDLNLGAFGGDIENFRNQISSLETELNTKLNQGILNTVNSSDQLKSIFQQLGTDLTKADASTLFKDLQRGAAEAAKEVATAEAALKKIQDKKLTNEFASNQLQGSLLYTEEGRKSLDSELNNIMNSYGNNFTAIRDKMTESMSKLNLADGGQKLLDNFFKDLTPDNIRERINNLYKELQGNFDTKGEFYKAIFGEGTTDIKNSSQVAKMFDFNQDTEQIKSQFRAFLDRIQNELKPERAFEIKRLIDKGQLEQAAEMTEKDLDAAYGRVQTKKKKLIEETAMNTQQETAAQQRLVTAQANKGNIDTANTQLMQQIEQLRQQNESLQQQINSLREQLGQKLGAEVGNIRKTGATENRNAGEGFKQSLEMSQAYKEQLAQVAAREQALGKLQGVVQRWFSIYAAIRMVRQAIDSVISTVKELDATITEIAIVTSMDQSELWDQMPKYTQLARDYAASISGVYQVSQLYYQQGLQTADVMALTEQTLKMARISGLDYAQATDYMTNAVRSFKMEMTDAQNVVDVYSAIAASSATSVTELASAMSKTASSAQAVGSSFENTTAMMAVMIEATRESPENIGSAMKSIISRYGELKENITGIDSEGEEYSLNKVDTALQSVGISAHDAAGQFREFDDVIFELAEKWDTIDVNTQRYIATVMAGNRQQSRFLALVSSTERLKELSATAADSENASQLQFLKTLDSVEAKTQQLETSIQALYINSGLEDFYKTILDFGNRILTTFDQLSQNQGLVLTVTKIGTSFTTLATLVTNAFNIIKISFSRTRLQIAAESKAEILERELDAAKLSTSESSYAQQSANNQISSEHSITENKAKEVEERLQLAKKEAQENSGSVFKSKTVLKKTGGMIVSAAGLALSTMAAQKDVNEERQTKALMTGFGSLASGIGTGMMIGGPAGIAVGTITAIPGIIEAIGMYTESVTDKVNRLNKAVTDASNKTILAKDEVKTLEDYKEKLIDLTSKQYDSAQAKQEYLDLNNEIANNYPELISYIDEEGNKIVSLSSIYDELYQKKKQAYAEAARDEGIARIAAASDGNTRLANAGIEAPSRKLDTLSTYGATAINAAQEVLSLGISSVNGYGRTNNFSIISKENEAYNYLSDQLASYGFGNILEAAKTNTFGGASGLDIYKALFGSSFDKVFTSFNPEKVSQIFQNNGLNELYKIDSSQSGLTQLGFIIDNLIAANQNFQQASTIISQIFGESITIDKDLYNYRKNATAVSSDGIEKIIKEENKNLFNNFSSLDGVKFSSVFDQEYLASKFQDSWKAYEEKYKEQYTDAITGAIDYTSMWTAFAENAEISIQELISGFSSTLSSLDLGIQTKLNNYFDSPTNYSLNDWIDLLGELNLDEETYAFIQSYINDRIVPTITNFNNSFKNLLARYHIDEDLIDYEGLSEGLNPQFLSAMYGQYEQVFKNSALSSDSQEKIIGDLNSIYSYIGGLDEKLRTPILTRLSTADLTSLSGINNFISGIEAIDDFELKGTDLNDALLKLKQHIKVNVSTEINSMLNSYSEGLQSLSDTLSKASKGMSLKDAIKTADELGITLADFNQVGDKFYLKDLTKLKEQYVKNNSDYRDEILQQINDQADFYAENQRIGKTDYFDFTKYKNLPTPEERRAYYEEYAADIQKLAPVLDTFDKFDSIIASSSDISLESLSKEMQSRMLQRQRDFDLNSLLANTTIDNFEEISSIIDTEYATLLSETGINVTALKNDIKSYLKNANEGELFSDYIRRTLGDQLADVYNASEDAVNYLLASTAISQGNLDTLLDLIFGKEGTEGAIEIDREAIKNQIAIGETDNLPKELQKYSTLIQDTFKSVRETTINSLISSVGGGSTQIKVTDLNKGILEQFKDKGWIIGDIETGEYVTVAAEQLSKNADEFQSYIAQSFETTSEKIKALGEYHKNQYINTQATSLDKVLTTEAFSYEDMLQYFVSTYQFDLDHMEFLPRAMKAAGLAFNSTGEVIVSNYEAWATSLEFGVNKLKASGKASIEDINSAERRLEDARNAQETARKTAVESILKSYQAFSGEDLEKLANALGEDYEKLKEEITTPNGDGTYKLNVPAIINKLNTAGISEATANTLNELIAGISDDYLAAITNAVSYQTKGATKIADMEKFVNQFNQATNQNLQVVDLFSYDTTVDAFTLNGDRAKQYIDAQRALLEGMGWADDAINAYIEDQTTKVAQDAISIEGLLNAKTEDERQREADKLASAIKDYLDLGNSISGLELKTYENAVKSATEAAQSAGLDSHELDDKLHGVWDKFSSLSTEQIINILYAGGEDAVKVLKQLKPEASADEISSVYSAAINRLNTALTDAENIMVGSIIDTGSKLYEVLKRVNSKGVDTNGVITAAYDMVEVYASIYEEMKNTAGATTTDLNSAYAKLLTQADQKNMDALDVLQNASGMTYDAFAELLSKYGQNFEQMMEYDFIQSDGFGKIQIIDFDAFAEKMGFDINSIEYAEAYSSYVDSMITLQEQPKKILESITSEIKSLAEGKIGDKLNVSYLSKSIGEESLSILVRQFGAALNNSILTITESTDIPGLVNGIIKISEEAGNILPEQMAELKDTISSLLSNITSLIKNGIQGTLSNVDVQQLTSWYQANGGVGTLGFTQTADGLKLTNRSARELYTTIRQVDALQGDIVFNELKESLIESEDHFKTIQETAAYIKQLQAGTAYPDNSERIADLEEELALAQKINAERSTTEDDSFKFMDNEIPSGQNNPLNYWSNWAEAFDALKTASSSTGKAKNTIGYQDFYNIVTEMGNLTQLTGKAVQYGKVLVDDSANAAENSITAAELIEEGAAALKNVDGELVVDLSKIKVDLNTSGLKNLGTELDSQIDAVAKSQIEMLDSLIKLLEVIVAMEALEDIDVDFDGQIDLSELFEDWDIETGDPTKFTQKAQDAANEILNQAKALDKNSALSQALDSVRINGKTVRGLLQDVASGIRDTKISAEQYQAAINALYQAMKSNDYDLDNIGESLFDILSNAGLDEVSVDVGKKTYYLTGQNQYIVDWDDEDAINKAIEALDNSGLFDTTKTNQEKIQAAITAVNKGKVDDIELTVEQKAVVNYGIKLATGEIKIDENTQSKGDYKDLYTGTYGGKTFANADKNQVEAEIKQALEIEAEGFTFDYMFDKETKTGTVTGTMKMGATTIKIDPNKEEKYEYNGQTYKTYNEAVAAAVKDGQVNQDMAGQVVNIGNDTYQVVYNADLNITYSVNQATEEITYQGREFKSQEALAEYVKYTNPLINNKNLKKNNKESKNNIEVYENGQIKIYIDYNTGKTFYQYDNNVFTDGKTFNDYVTARELAEKQKGLGGEVNLNGNEVKFTYLGQYITLTVNAETGEVTYTATVDGNQITANSLSAFESALATLGKLKSKTITSNGDTATFEYKRQQIKVIWHADGNIEVTDPEGNPIDETIAEEIRKAAESAQGETTIDTNLKATIISAITDAFTSLSTTLSTLDYSKVTELGTAFATVYSNLQTVAQGINALSEALTALTGIDLKINIELPDLPTPGEPGSEGAQNGLTFPVGGEPSGSTPDAVEEELKEGKTVAEEKAPEIGESIGQGLDDSQSIVSTAAGELGNAIITKIEETVIKVQESIAKITEAIEQLKNTQLEIDTDKVLNNIKQVQEALDRLSETKPKIEVDTANAEGQLEALKNKLKTIDTQQIIHPEGQIEDIDDFDTTQTINTVGGVSDIADFTTVQTIVTRGGGNDGGGSGLPAVNKPGANGSKNLPGIRTPSTSATGNFGLAKSKGTLMGELGPELVVTNGHYFVAGQNGAEIVNLTDDAIVFNHLQTEQLLTKGMSSSRGRAVTNERNAVAFATGNINGGPAMASASAALAALKQLKAMWESLQSASVSDLAGAGGGGGGGGGSSGDDDDIVDPSVWIDTVERWYSLTQEIAKLEKEITYQEQIRAKISSDWQKNGRAYYQSQRKSLNALEEEIKAQEELNISRQDYYKKRQAALEKSNFGKIYSFDDEGQLHFNDNANLKIGNKTYKDSMEWYRDLIGFDDTKGANYTNKEKYDILVANGFESYMKYDENGEAIKMDEDNDGEITDEERESFYENATKAWKEKLDDYQETTQSLWDEIQEGNETLEELEEKRNEILQEMRDNQLDVEDKVLSAIEDMKQREIDDMQDLRDTIDESAEEYINGLTDALSKEKEMYETQESQAELTRKQRQLGILQRSGGSATDIKALQDEIESSQRDQYFNLQQQQIDAIQEAADAQIERLDTQIDLMTETLEYQKTYGLLWGEVYQVMAQDSAAITAFITGQDSSFWSASPLANAQTVNDLIFKTEQWEAYRKDIEIIRDESRLQQADRDYATFDAGMKAQYGNDYDKSGEYKKQFYNIYNGKDAEGNLLNTNADSLTAATQALTSQVEKDAKIAQRKKEAGNYWTHTGPDRYISIDDNQHWHYKYKEETIEGVKGWYFSSKKKEDHEWDNKNKCSKCGHKKPTPQSSEGGGGGFVPPNGCGASCSGYCKGQLVGGSNSSSSGCRSCASSCSGGCKGTERMTFGNSLAYLASGGMINKPTHAIVGETGEPEAVLNPTQTKILRENILSNRPSSLISLLKTYNEGFSRMDTPLTGTTTEDNSTNIDKLEFSMNVQQISNDYDAKRAGEQAMNEIMRIARKTSAANSIRR